MGVKFYTEEGVSYKYSFDQKISVDEFIDSKNSQTNFCYAYIEYAPTELSFIDNQNFSLADTEIYFKRVNFFSKKTIDELMNEINFEDRFQMESGMPKGALNDILIKIIQKKPIKIEEIPQLGHFRLYTKPQANREKDIKAPRVHFFIGRFGTIYPLLLDLYHEVHPQNNN